jgi:hypothetical protein
VYKKDLTPKDFKNMIRSKIHSPFYSAVIVSEDQLSTLDDDVRFLRRLDEVTRGIPNLSVESKLNGIEIRDRYFDINNVMKRLLEDDEFGERAEAIWENKRLNWTGFAQTVQRRGLFSQDFDNEGSLVRAIEKHMSSDEGDPFRSLKCIRKANSDCNVCFTGKNIVVFVEISQFQMDVRKYLFSLETRVNC